jgi:hypothetical protein
MSRWVARKVGLQHFEIRWHFAIFDVLVIYFDSFKDCRYFEKISENAYMYFLQIYFT